MAIKQVPVLKFINKNKRDIRLRALEKEIELLSTLSHENIVKYLGKHNDGKFLNIFLEYVSGGSINVLLRKYK
jgi:mitogen-activated protein kinase kinase kinase